MTDSIPSRRPYTQAERAEFKREHYHTPEHDDGYAPVFYLQHRHDDEETPVTRPPETSEEIRAALGEHPPAVDYGVRALRAATDAGLLRQAGLDGDLAVGLATAHAQENSLVALDAKEEGFTSGQRAGFVEGLRFAQGVVLDAKTAVRVGLQCGDEWDVDDMLAVLDDLIGALQKRATAEGGS